MFFYHFVITSQISPRVYTRTMMLASKCEHVMPKQALIGCRMWHDLVIKHLLINKSLADFRAQNVHHQQRQVKL